MNTESKALFMCQSEGCHHIDQIDMQDMEAAFNMLCPSCGSPMITGKIKNILTMMQEIFGDEMCARGNEYDFSEGFPVRQDEITKN